MPEKRYRRATSAALRNLLDLLSAEERETTTVAAFLRQFEEHGLEISDYARSMVERILDRDGEALDYDAVFAAADDLVACCNGSLERALDALRVYKAVSGKQMSVEGPFAAS
ncbi:MAG: hypothetical protein ABIP48_18605 [Planctomycetota bacterium]